MPTLDTPKRPGPLAETIFRGALLLGLTRFVIRGLGFLSVIVTARLLTPADLGLIGTAALVTGFFAVLQQNGIGDALTRLSRVTGADVSTAWSINLATSLLVATAVFAAAGPASAWLAEPNLRPVLQHLAATPVLAALASPGAMLLLRNLEFRRDFRLRIAQKILMVAATLGCVLIWRDWWGLVYGALSGAAAGTLLTYLMCPAVPRLSFAGAGYFLSFSGWSFAQSLGTYLWSTSDRLAVRRVSDTETFGLYNMGRDLTLVLVTEAVSPATGALLPGLARLQDDPQRFARAAANAIGVAAIIAVPIGLGLALTAHEAVLLLLGPQWTGTATFLALTAIGGIGGTLTGLHRPVLAARGWMRAAAALAAFRAAVLFAACSAAAAYAGAVAVAQTYLVASLLLCATDYALIFRWLGRPSAPLAAFARPAAAGGAMALALLLPDWPAGAPVVLVAALKVTLGAGVYGITLLGLWWASGRPDGAERLLVERLPPQLAARLMPKTG